MDKSLLFVLGLGGHPCPLAPPVVQVLNLSANPIAIAGPKLGKAETARLRRLAGGGR